MKNLSLNQTSAIFGGGFWGGAACGVTVAIAIADPTKISVALAVVTCGWAFE